MRGKHAYPARYGDRMPEPDEDPVLAAIDGALDDWVSDDAMRWRPKLRTGGCHDRGETRIRWTGRPDGLEESVRFTPGFICPVQGGSGHGRHGMEIRWLLRGPRGGAQFVLYTDWLPGKASSPSVAHMFPMGADVGYHAKRPMYEGQEPLDSECEITGGACWYDGSGLRAMELAERFKVDGEQIVWDQLEAVYADLIEPEAGGEGHGDN